MNNNKLIAEFMGRTTTYDIWDNDSDRGEVLLTKGLDASCVEDEIAHYEDRYGSANIEAVETPIDYKSWNELMPVVDTINDYVNDEGEPIYSVEIDPYTCMIRRGLHTAIVVDRPQADSYREMIYLAVVEFAKRFHQYGQSL